MRRLTTLLMTLMLLCMASWAEQTVTVSANSSDISEGLDLKVVAKLFAEAKNLEEFETMLNNPDSAFCNLDLNGDGQVDYLRVIETGEGNKRLIVLQAILAKDIYQDVASIYVEKDEKDQVSVQIVGDEYVYGEAYIIEPVFVYRPIIYDWFWCDAWYAWHSPWYWGYWPGWWYVHDCWAHDWYWRHCYAWHHHHHCCSFRRAHAVRHGYRDLHRDVSRRDYAAAHPDRSFSERNAGMRNAGDIRRSSGSIGGTRTASGSATTRGTGSFDRTASDSRTYGSRNTAATRSAEGRTAGTRTTGGSATTRSSGSYSTRSASASTGSRSEASSRSTGSRTSSGSYSTRSTGRSSSYSTRSASSSRSAGSTYSTSRSAGSSSSSARTYSGSSSSRSGGSYSSPSRSSSSSSYGGSRSSGGYSGGGSRSSGGFSGGGGGRSGGGSAGTRR